MISKFWPEQLEGWSYISCDGKGYEWSPFGKKDKEFSHLVLYGLRILKLFWVRSRIKHIVKVRIIEVRSVTVKKRSYKYGKGEDWNETCGVGLGLELEKSV